MEVAGQASLLALQALQALQAATTSAALREALLGAMPFAETPAISDALIRARQRLKELKQAEAAASTIATEGVPELTTSCSAPRQGRQQVAPCVMDDHTGRFEEQYARAQSVGVPFSELDALTDKLASSSIDLSAAADALEEKTRGYYLVGQRVRARGLAAKPEINGRVGFVSTFVADRGRCVVHFDKADEPMLLRPANLSATEDVAWALHAELDGRDKQPRDWPHRPGIDPPNAFVDLWRPPFRQGSQGAVETPACQCLRSDCQSAGRSCGMHITDPVICWRCERFFGLHCVGRGPEALVPAGGLRITTEDPDSIDDTAQMDTAVKLTRWAACPRCAAPLGAASMPQVFRSMLSVSLHRGRDSARVPGDASSMGMVSIRGLAVELKDALRDADAARVARRTGEAIEGYTRAIRCVNLGRSFFSPSLHLMSDGFLHAHTQRALLEGHVGLATRLSAYGLAHRPHQVDAFHDAAAFHAAFLGLQDIRGVFPRASLARMVGHGVPRAPGAHLPAPLDEDDDISYDLLANECRSMNYWVAAGMPPRPGAFLMTVFDFRWAFATEAAAIDYFARIEDFRSEENAVVGPRMRRTGKKLANADECAILQSCAELSPSLTGMHMNAMFRAGRLCGKFYASVVHHTTEVTAESRGQAYAQLARLAEVAVVKAREAVCHQM